MRYTDIRADDYQEMITTLSEDAYDIAEARGWHDIDRTPGELLMLIVSETAEALEIIRLKGIGDANAFWTDSDGKPTGLAVELADILIRVLDHAPQMGVSPGILGEAFRQKMAYNKTRPYRHGNKTL